MEENDIPVKTQSKEICNYSGQPLRFGARRASVILPFTLSAPVPAALSLRTRCCG
jgi:hypothetical protein